MNKSEQKLRSFIREEIKSLVRERADRLDHFVDLEDYKYGNPSEAAENLKQLLDTFIDGSKRELSKAGGPIEPGLKQALKKDLLWRLERELKIK